MRYRLAMASPARLRLFTTADERVVSTLNGWMLWLAILHFVAALFSMGCGCLAGVGAIGRIASSPLGGSVYALLLLTLPILGAVMGLQGVFALQARSALDKMVTTHAGDPRLLSEAFGRLKAFFLLELVWFGIAALSSILGVILVVVAPELADPGGLSIVDDGARWSLGGGR